MKLIKKEDPFEVFDSETPDYGVLKQKTTRIEKDRLIETIISEEMGY